MALAPGYLVTTVIVGTPTGPVELKAGAFIRDVGLLVAIAYAGGQTVASNTISDAAAAACARARSRGQDELALQAIMMAAYTSQLSGSVTAEQTLTVNFSFNTPSPLILRTTKLGDANFRALIAVLIPFNDPTATIEFGTSAAPGEILGPTESTLSIAAQYSSLNIAFFLVPDVLQLTISPRAATVGSGVLLYSYYQS